MRGKIYTNVGSSVSEADRANRDRIDKNNEIIEKRIADSSGYVNHGELNTRNVIVTNDQVDWNAQDVRKRRDEGLPVLSVYTWEDEHGEICHMLTEGDREAVMQGYLCENCLGWQKSNLTMECETIHDFTCKYTRGL